MVSHTVLLLEDDPATRERLQGIVCSAEGLQLLAAFGDVQSTLAWLAQNPPPQVLLSDLQLPDGSGIEVIRHLRRVSPQTESMVISVFGDEAHVVAAIEAGATGYLLKDADADEIRSAILRLVAGESPISSAIARHLLRRFQPQPEPAATASSLTPREREVLQLIAKGLSYNRIAEALQMSPNTVTSHIKQIYRKLAVNSRGEAVFEAQQLGWLNAPRP
ncbi:MAG: response regulator transcription factor [Rubrivivax sp.]|nr:response regulator transcription factor [Rubrivivax sp.]MDP3222730.1 response regulator transcription factor [Rubrivivax sp.]MDP3613712.1 response regulator transcription factor [Rubrivivax sp.]